MLLGWTQEALAAALGVSFQQVQKYERGANRVSASMLEAVASALDAPIAYFFGKDETAEHAFLDPLALRETIEVVRGYYALPAAIRPKVLELMRAIAAHEGVPSRSDPQEE